MAYGFEDRNRVADERRKAEEDRTERLEKGTLAAGDVTIRDKKGRSYIVVDDDRGAGTAVPEAKGRHIPRGDRRAFQEAKAQQKVEFQRLNLQNVDFGEVEEVVTGVIASSVIAEGVRAHANRPGSWNVAAFPSATIDESFSSFEWPAPQPLFDLVSSGEMRAYTAGVDEHIAEGDGSEIVVTDEGISVSPAYASGTTRRTAIADALRQQAMTGVSYSLQLTAICIDAAGLKAIDEVLKEQSLTPELQYYGMRWAGILQHHIPDLPPKPMHAWINLPGHTLNRYNEAGQQVGTVTLLHDLLDSSEYEGTGILDGYNAKVVLQNRPDPTTFIAGSEENTVDNPPPHAIVEIAAWSEPQPQGALAPHVWHVYATRMR